MKIVMSCESSEVNILCQEEVAGNYVFELCDPSDNKLPVVSKFPLIECCETHRVKVEFSRNVFIQNNSCILS